MWSGQLGELSIIKHHIDLQENAKPAYQAPYRAGKQSREIERQEVDRMFKAGVIEPATSEWASPVVRITKKDGSIRFCRLSETQCFNSEGILSTPSDG
jgi:hypothetical protein